MLVTESLNMVIPHSFLNFRGLECKWVSPPALGQPCPRLPRGWPGVYSSSTSPDIFTSGMENLFHSSAVPLLRVPPSNNLLTATLIIAGALNDVRAEGKGRSTQQPCKRLNLKTFSL